MGRRRMSHAEAATSVKALTKDGRRLVPAVPTWCALLALLAASVGHTSASPQEAKGGAEEVFEKVDPYTRGESAALDKAGYLSFGPFPLAEGIHTRDLEELLGGVRILWVET